MLLNLNESSSCYGLNHVPHKFMLKPHPSVVVFGDGPFRRHLRLEEVTGGALIPKDCCPYTDAHCEMWPPAGPGERRRQEEAGRLVSALASELGARTQLAGAASAAAPLLGALPASHRDASSTAAISLAYPLSSSHPGAGSEVFNGCKMVKKEGGTWI